MISSHYNENCTNIVPMRQQITSLIRIFFYGNPVTTTKNSEGLLSEKKNYVMTYVEFDQDETRIFKKNYIWTKKPTVTKKISRYLSSRKLIKERGIINRIILHESVVFSVYCDSVRGQRSQSVDFRGKGTIDRSFLQVTFSIIYTRGPHGHKEVSRDFYI